MEQILKEGKRMIAVIINALAVVIGSTFGLLFKKGIPEKLNKALMAAVGLCVLYIGISGTLEGQNTLVLICSMVCGTLIGTLLDIDAALTRLGDAISAKFSSKGGTVSITEGFVTATLLFCVGAMAIVGSLDSGLRGEHETLLTKSLLDMISSCMLSVTLGIGVMLSGVSIFIYQGAIVLLAQLIAPLLTESIIAELTCCGSVMIAALSLNMLGITKFKIANFLPALVFVPLWQWLLSCLPL